MNFNIYYMVNKSVKVAEVVLVPLHISANLLFSGQYSVYVCVCVCVCE